MDGYLSNSHNTAGTPTPAKIPNISKSANVDMSLNISKIMKDADTKMLLYHFHDKSNGNLIFPSIMLIITLIVHATLVIFLC